MSSRSTRCGSTDSELVGGREDLLDPAHQALDVPVLDEVADGVLGDQAVDQVDDLLAGGGAHVAALEHLVAIGVDHLALLVEHVVVLQRVLAVQEVLLLDLALGLLDLLGEHPGLDRLLVALVVDGSEAVQDLVDPLAGEQPDQVVLGGEEEARLAGVALTSGAAAQLVVDPAGLVALGAEDEQAAGLHHLLRAAPRRAPRSPAAPWRRCSS